jgi:hypothetical protein
MYYPTSAATKRRTRKRSGDDALLPIDMHGVYITYAFHLYNPTDKPLRFKLQCWRSEPEDGTVYPKGSYGTVASMLHPHEMQVWGEEGLEFRVSGEDMAGRARNFVFRPAARSSERGRSVTHL